MVGSACVYFLSRAGLKVTLLERQGIASGTSGCSMGHLMVVPAPEVLYELTYHSVQLWHGFARDVGGFDFWPTGALWVGDEPEDLALLQGLEKDMQRHGEKRRLLDPAELLELEPNLAPDLVGGFHYSEDAIIFPMTAITAMLNDAVRHGAEVLPWTPALGLRRNGAGAVQAVRTPNGEIDTGAVVNAAGVWAPKITEWAGLPAAPIYPRRGDLAITMPHQVPISCQILEVGYLRTAAGQTIDPAKGEPDPGAWAMNVQPQGNGTLLIGSTRQFAGFEREVNLRLLHESLERASRFVPAVLDLTVVRTWAGLRPYTTDKLPILGPVPEVQGLYMACGHEGLGITLALATGELIAQSVTGQETSMDLLPFSLGRFAGYEAAHG
ncbi:MAG: NAD(P)/FAD-dependent oxidoreductase [Planctomycetota bacterium]